MALPFGGQLMPGSNNFSMLDAFMTQIFTQTVEEELDFTRPYDNLIWMIC